MTDEQINAAIAEACGWTDIGECTCRFRLRGYPPEYSAHKKHTPNYCTDLNAMHEAEQIIMDTDLFFDYCLHTGPLLRATARQRAEAFLRTLGKWEEATDKDSLMVQTTTTEQSSVDHVGGVTQMMEELE